MVLPVKNENPEAFLNQIAFKLNKSLITKLYGTLSAECTENIFDPFWNKLYNAI